MLLNFTQIFYHVDLNSCPVNSVFLQVDFDKLYFVGSIDVSAIGMEKYSKEFASASKAASNSL